MQKHIYDLELSLLTSSGRQSIRQLNLLIADGFIEFGSSGKMYNKNDLLEALPIEEPSNYTVEDFKTSELSKNVILATYKVAINAQCSLRSSIWKFNGRHWQMVFHQGTNCAN